jgi:hypothetical protein
MCGGGDLGGSNNKDNDNKKGSGNSAGEKLANAITPNDGFSYRDGRLTADRASSTYTGGGGGGGGRSVIFANPNRADKMIPVFNNDGKGQFLVPKSETKKYNDGLVMSAVFGAVTGGLPGIIAGVGGNMARNALFSGGGDGNKDRRNVSAVNTNVGSGTVSDRFGNAIQGATGIAGVTPGGYTDPSTYTKGVHYGTTNDGGFKGMFQPGGFFAGPEFGSAEERSKYMLEQKNKAVEAGRSMADGSDNNDDRVRQTVATPTVAGPSGPAMSDMSAAAAEGAFEPIPNPDYDPNDPMSPRFIINPSYAQLLEYQQSQVTKMRGGGYPGQMLSANAAFKMRRPAYSEPLKQYGNYLEGEYGDAGFEQKKDNFLEEVNMKERQTFSNSGVLPTGGGISSMLMGQPRPDSRGPMFGMHQGGPGQLGMPEGYDRIDRGTFPQNILGSVRGFAPGGELEQAPQEGIAAVPQEGGNEKTDIVDAVMAVKGEMSKEEASVALGKFLATYGEEALKNLVEAVQSGELDDTIERFANGEAGEVNGPGDGSGVDDKVPASLEGQEDVLLADGEFVLRANTADKLTKAFGGGFLDAVNQSEDNAPRVIREYAAKTAIA